MDVGYQSVRDELAKGTPGAALCATCPWYRPCVNPPPMTSAGVQAAVKEAAAEAPADNPGHRASTAILAAMVYGGKDSAGEMCPVFAERLTGPDGRELADAVRGFMRGPV